jgi:hypothetical protein
MAYSATNFFGDIGKGKIGKAMGGLGDTMNRKVNKTAGLIASPLKSLGNMLPIIVLVGGIFAIKMLTSK